MSIAEQTKKKTIMLAVSVSIVAWAVIFFILDYQFKNSVNERFDNLFESTKALFKINTIHEQQNFALQLEKIISIDGVAEAVANKNHTELDLLLSEYYIKLKNTFPDIKILTFRSNEGITLYRAHKPEFYGDKLNKKRKLIVDTNHLKKSLHGFEVGKLDMTYRVTQPIFHQGNYVGNVEIGLNPIHFIKDLKNVFNMEMGVAIDRSLLSIMLDGKEIPIDENYLFLNGSQMLEHYFKKNIEQNSSSLENDDLLKIKMNIPLDNHLHETLGHLIVGFDTTSIVKNDKDFMYRLFFMLIFMMSVLGIVLHRGFNRILNYYTDQVYTDHLTGLNNRVALNSALQSKKAHAVILSNIKEFTLINELYGLDTGNEVLLQVAHAFEEFSSQNTFDVFRISSDEYVLVREENAFDVLHYNEIVIDLQRKINSLKIWVDGLNDFIGIEIYSGIAYDHTHSLEDAQMALRMAKERALPYLAYTEKLDTKKRSEVIIQMKRTIRYALEHKNVIPFFQPICNKDGVVIKYEALARIIEFDEGKKHVLAPAAFLDISMKSGLYMEIAVDMLEQSLAYFSKRDEKIAINFLPKDFFNSKIIDLLLESIKKFDSPEKIVIEITEQEGVEDFERLVKVIKMLRKLGVLIAIDDFGSGYANYAHILTLKPDYLKIDGSLIKNILTDEDSRILVNNIVNFARDLNIKTVAEYVENEEIFELLKDFGVDEYQGYYFSPPIDLINEQK